MVRRVNLQHLARRVDRPEEPHAPLRVAGVRQTVSTNVRRVSGWSKPPLRPMYASSILPPSRSVHPAWPPT